MKKKKLWCSVVPVIFLKLLYAKDISNALIHKMNVTTNVKLGLMIDWLDYTTHVAHG